jgi:hypothetical protein
MMTAPWPLPWSLDKLGPDWVQMDIAQKSEEISIIIARRGQKPPLEKMPVPIPASVEGTGIARQQPLHDIGYRRGPLP